VIFTDLKLFDIVLHDASLRPMGTDRAPGMHVSHIVRKMKEAAGEKVTGVEGEQAELRPQIGFLWELALEHVWKEYARVVRPVSHQLNLKLNDVSGTPDGFDDGSGWAELRDEDLMGDHLTLAGIRSDVPCIEEYKFTWRSLRKWQEDPRQHFWSWIVQGMAYLKMLSELLGLPVRRLRYFIFWAGGDYRYGLGHGPQPTVTDIDVTDEEVEENWQSMMRYKAWMEKGGVQ